MIRSQRSRRNRLSAVALSIVATLLASGCSSIYDLPLPGGVDVGDDPIEVTLMFRDVLDLVPQSTVKVDDVSVGKVTKITVDDYVARVTILLKDSDLPDNAVAEIRQTSLLGEKFVSLKEPENPSAGKLGNGDLIPLDRTGRNPEVEEVLGALALLLNGGGVGQLQTIAQELNVAVGGRETEVRSVITQIRTFMAQLDNNKASIITAIENLNRLSIQLRKEDPSIKAALDDIPAALRSVNSQRADLVKMLQALQKLSGVGVQVISESKDATINSLQSLSPVLSRFAEAGSDFPKALSVLLSYPFVDETVGRDPQVARNMHLGDFVNLSVRLDLSLENGLPGLPGGPALPPLPTLNDLLDQCAATPLAAVCATIPIAMLCGALPANPLCRTGATPPGTSPLPPLPTLPAIPGLPGLGLGRTATGAVDPIQPRDPFELEKLGYDAGLGTLLLQGVGTKA